MGGVKLSNSQKMKNIWVGCGPYGGKSHLMRDSKSSLCGRLFEITHTNIASKSKCEICLKIQESIDKIGYQEYFSRDYIPPSNTIKKIKNNRKSNNKNTNPKSAGAWKIGNCKTCKKTCGYFSNGHRNHDNDTCPRCGGNFG